MKTNLKNLVMAALMLVAVTSPAELIVPNTATNVLFRQTVPVLLSTQTTNQTNGGLTNAPVLVEPGFGMGFFFSMTNWLDTVGVSNATFGINVSPDGTNWPSSPTISFTKANNGATPVSFYTNIPATSLDGARAVRLESIQIAATNSVGFTNVFFSRTRLQTRIP